MTTVELENKTLSPGVSDHVEPLEMEPAAHDVDDAAKALDSDLVVDWTEEEAAKVRHKTDWILLPLMAFGAGILLTDKTGLGSAATLTLIHDLKLVGSQYSWAVSIYYFGLLLGTHPFSLLTQRFHTGRVAGIAFLFWGISVLGMLAVKSYSGLLACRFFLGLFESCAIPAFTLVTARFYTPNEQPLRFSLWALGNSVFPIPMLVIFYAIGRVPDHPLEPWRWIFCLLGSLTVIMGILLLLFFPDRPDNWRLYTPAQRRLVTVKIALAQTGIKNHRWKREQAIEALCDPKVWMLTLMFACQQPAPNIITNFSGIIIKGYGFTGLQSLLLQIPAWLIAVTSPLFGYLATHTRFFRNRKTWLGCACSTVALIAEILLFCYPPKTGVKAVGPLVYASLLSIDQVLYPMILTLVGQNNGGSTKKQTAMGIVYCGYCISNIVVPQSFLARESPRYHTGLAVTISAQACLSVTAILLYFWTVKENKKRAAVRAAAEEQDADRLQSGLNDESDRKNQYFHYSG